MGDLFDAIEEIEQELISRGEEEGKKHAEKKHFEEGFVYGWQQACHIQSELGMIEGFFSTILENSPDLKQKDINSINKLLADIRRGTEWNPSDEGTLEQKLGSLQSRARFILKKLNIQSKILNREIDGEF